MVKSKSNNIDSSNNLKFALKNIGKIELIILIIIFTALFFSISFIKISNGYYHSDTAGFYEITENIASRGLPISHINPSFSWWYQEGLGSKPASEICNMSLGSEKINEINVFTWHTFFIIYLMAPLTYFISAHILWQSLTSFTFIGFIALIYIILREKNTSIIFSFIFCLLIMAHPAWQQSLLGEVVPDRFFLFLGLLFIYLFSDKNTNLKLLFVIGLLICSLQERAALIIGIVTVLYTLLYWSNWYNNKNKILRLSMGFFFILIAVLAFSFIINNFIYPYYLPANFGDLIMRFSNPDFMNKLIIFSIFNLIILGILSIFEWKSFIIALAVMSFNIFGNIGGAEKIGFILHYHSYYFPLLVWAAMLGYIHLLKIFNGEFKQKLFLIAMVFLIILTAGINPYKYDNFNFSLENIKNNGLIETIVKIPSTLQGNVNPLIKNSEQLQNAVPIYSEVTMPEGIIPYLYKHRKVHYFPAGLDTSDYAVLTIEGKKDSQFIYGGAWSYVGTEHQKSLNDCLIDRMKREGYDFDNATIIESAQVAIIKRIS